ncbi:TetR/AcrR family transcriptional regulator [Streptomyces sp. DSM 44917]|uniref:TetR/AcrR family transcriptional regulator n=1 Tax=Streptomyces boetiae TaxID=3075541 RepID=A0ABU2L4T3_9ACTN|nr:TetR/AcrR family transcriptional regulator [Streptomyces sp. DSM 44917]MDT0306569.1 TetR/AcrR family transcriptional regulator [Streptomyces sp. DSM 44917]
MNEETVRRPRAGRARTRLDTGQRREQLLSIGLELFAERPYDEVWIEQVAELANVSRGLLYHYFPTKRDFFVAVIRREGERLFEMTGTDPGAPAADRLAAGLDAYLSYAEGHAKGYRAFHRANVTSDQEIREIYEELLVQQQERIVEVLTEDCRAPAETLRLAVRGWLAFIVTVCLEWLATRSPSREEVRDLCIRTLLCAVSPRAHG